MLRKLHLLKQPFAIAPIRSSLTTTSRLIQATACADRASVLQQSLCPSSPSIGSFRSTHRTSCNSGPHKSKIDTSHVPRLNEDDLEVQFIKGSGPGGSKVNKKTNCCLLRHKPSGIVVKCHLSRILDENRKLARAMLIEKLDEFYNGENSVKAQKARLLAKKGEESERKRLKHTERKEKYKELLLEDANFEKYEELLEGGSLNHIK